MREAIAAAAHNPELLAEAAKMKLDMVYRPPEHLEQLVTHLYETPPRRDRNGQEDQSKSSVTAKHRP